VALSGDELFNRQKLNWRKIMIVEKDFRLLVTNPDGDVKDVTLTKSVHTESGFFPFKNDKGLRSWLLEFNLEASADKVTQLRKSLRDDETISMISDEGSFWGPAPFKGAIFVDLSPKEFWNRINQAQQSNQACLDLTEVTGGKALKHKVENILSTLKAD
jgi:hypothetical protein